jgi:ribosomal protein S18 acetylase RimI-like enzyme
MSQKKPKAERYFDDMDITGPEEDTSKNASNVGNKTIPMKIRRIFNPEQEKEQFLQAQIHDKTRQEFKKQTQDYLYLQMRLDVIKITPQYEKNLSQYRMQSVKVRLATEEDIPELTKVYNRSFMTGTDPYSPITQDHMVRIMAAPREVLVAMGYGKMMGFIILDVEGDDNQYAVICGLGTDPAWRRRGVGKYLGYEAWNHIRDRNMKEIRCEVYEKNHPSIALIKSLEFEEYGQKVYQW